MSQPPPHALSHVRAFDHVRALAAFSVVIHHVEQAKALLGLPGIWLAPWIQSLGTGGVDVFFGLSGFVITQSLLRARASRAGALLARFYLRRGLRILPLYLAMVAVAFSPLPWLLAGAEPHVGAVLEGALRARDEHYGVLLVLHLLGLPNTALAAFPGVPFATHLWSVGAEMQFYLVWPLFFVLTRHVWTAAAVATVVTLLVETLLRNAEGGLAGLTPWTVGVIEQTLGTIHARYLLAGIGAAALVSGAGARLRSSGNPADGSAPRPVRALHWTALAAIVGLLLARHLLPLTDWLSPVVLAAALTGLALSPQGPGLPTSVADHLGRISYSIYVWHLLVIGLVAVTVGGTVGLHPWGASRHLALYLGVVAGTIAVATVSFRFIEQPFLRVAATRR